MNWKANKNFAIALGLLSALLAGLLALGFLTASAKGELAQDLRSKQAEHDRLRGAAIFPSMQNVRKLEEENQRLEEFLAKVETDLLQRQPTPVSATNPSDFNLLLEAERNAILRLAAETQSPVPSLDPEARDSRPVAVHEPAKFWFDFDDYGVGGKTPDLKHIADLSVQLKGLRAVCEALIRAGVSEIGPVERQKIETPAGKPKPPPPPPPRKGRKKKAAAQAEAEEPALVLNNFTVGVRFSTAEANLWRALGEVANLPLPFVITQVEVRNQHPTLQAGAGTGPTLSAPTVNPLAALAAGRTTTGGEARQESAGTEMVQVHLRLRVYRMEKPVPPGEEADPDAPQPDAALPAES
jgi:hypothetical protein